MLKKQKESNLVEAGAISSLLEEDQKTHEEHSTWADKKRMDETLRNHKLTPYLANKTRKPRNLFKNNTQKRSSRKLFNPQMLKQNEIDANDWINAHLPIQSKNAENSKSNYEIDGSYWWSKVNWTSFGLSDAPTSKSKHKRHLSQSYESSSQLNRKVSRFQMYQKARNNEYKTELIYSILNGEQHKVNTQYHRPNNHRYKNMNSSMHDMPTKQKDKRRKDDQQPKVNKHLEHSMRQTLKKFVIKNHDEGVGHFSLGKQEEQKRSSLVRQMINNMQLLREGPLEKEVPQIQELIAKGQSKARRQEKSVKKNNLSREDPFDVSHSRGVVNLNLEAERVYKTRSVNRRYLKDPLASN